MFHITIDSSSKTPILKVERRPQERLNQAAWPYRPVTALTEIAMVAFPNHFHACEIQYADRKNTLLGGLRVLLQRGGAADELKRRFSLSRIHLFDLSPVIRISIFGNSDPLHVLRPNSCSPRNFTLQDDGACAAIVKYDLE